MTFTQCVGLFGGSSGEFKLLTTLKMDVLRRTVTFQKTSLQNVKLTQKTGSSWYTMPNKIGKKFILRRRKDTGSLPLVC